jgi:DNA-directed RNA polymerase II subunit RPB4
MSKGNAVNRDEELNEVYRKTLKYVMRFNTMSNPEKQNQEVVDELDNLQEYVRPRMLLSRYCMLTL